MFSNFRCFSLGVVVIRCSLVGVVAIAQNGPQLNTPKKFISEVEFFAGPSVTNFWGSGRSTDQVLNFRYAFGAAASHQLDEQFDVNVSLIFERKGSKVEYNEIYFNDDGTTQDARYEQGDKIDYVNLAASIRYCFGSKRNFHVGLGPFMSRVQKVRNYTNIYDLQDRLIESHYLSGNSYNHFDYGLKTAVGYKFTVRPKLLINSQLLYTLGLSDILKDEIPYDGSIRIYAISMLAGATLKI